MSSRCTACTGEALIANWAPIDQKPVKAEPHKRGNMADRLRARFEPLGGADDLKIPHRERSRDLPFTFGFNDGDDNPT